MGDLQTTVLGKSGLTVTKLSAGGHFTNGPTGHEDIERRVAELNHMIDCGIKYFDVQWDPEEIATAEVMKTRKDEMVVAWPIHGITQLAGDLKAQYVIDYLRVDDSKALFATNNEDGRAHAGEQLEIRFSVKNDSTVSLSSFTLSGSSPSPWLTIGAPQQAHSLSPGQEIMLALPARVSRDLKEITTVDLIVAVNPDSGGQSLLRTFPITLYPPPLILATLQSLPFSQNWMGEIMPL